MEALVRTPLKELSAPPVLVYPDWDAVADNSRPFILYYDVTSMVLEPHLSRNKNAAQYALLFSSATLHLSLSDAGPCSTSRLAASSGVSSASKDVCGVPPSASFRTTRRSKASPGLSSTTPESRDGSNFSQRSAILSGTAKAAQTETPTFFFFLSRLPLTASEDDHSGRSRLAPSDEERIYLIRSGGLALDGPPTLSPGLGGLAPSSHSIGLGGLPLSQADFRDFREHGPRMRIDDLDVPYGEFVARAPISVFRRVSSRTLTASMHAASDPSASVFVVPVVPPPASTGVGQNNVSLPPKLGSSAAELTSPALSAPTGSVSLGTDIVTPTTTNPQPFFHGDAEDLGSQASPAQRQATSHVAKSNRTLVVALPRLSSTSQARPSSLVPSDPVSTRTRRRQAIAAGSPKPSVDYGFDSPAFVSRTAAKPAAVA